MFDPSPDLGRPDAGLLAALRAQPAPVRSAPGLRDLLAANSVDLAAVMAQRRAEACLLAEIFGDLSVMPDPAGGHAARKGPEPTSDHPPALAHLTIVPDDLRLRGLAEASD